MEGKQEFNPVPEGIMVKGGVDVAAGKPTTQLEGPPTMAAFQPLSVVMPTQGSTGDAEVNKRRGRPRKYGPGAVPAAAALSPMPISASIPLSGDFSGWKQHTAATTTAAATTAAASATAAARDKPFPTIKKVHRPQSESNGDRLAFLVGGNFTPHMITVNAGEDVAMKILSFSLLESQAICVLSATGSISLVTLRHPNSSGGTLTYEGCFEILSLSGSFMPIYNGILKSRSGGLSVSLAGPDGRVLGGGLAGLLIAASPVQVVLGSFLPGQQLEQKPKKQRTEPSLAPNREATGGGQKLNLASYQMQDSKDVETDNNLSSSSPEGESDEDSPSRYQMSG